MRDGSALDTQALAIDHALDIVVEPAAPPVGPTPLTRREAQVAALAAQGVTNRRSPPNWWCPRTVDSHVDRILTKLGSSSTDTPVAAATAVT